MKLGLLVLAAALVGAFVAVPSPQAQGPSFPGDCDFDRRAVSGNKRAVSPRAPNPLAGERWYLDTKASRYGHAGYREPAFGDYMRFKGRRKALMGRIALQPRFQRFGRFTPMPLRICAFIADAEAAGGVPLVTTLRHQGKECHSRYRAGGVAEDNRTKEWFDDFARGVGASRAIIAFEVDSLGTIECLARSRRKARYRLLRYGVRRLAKLPNATIYIEAGASDWEGVRPMARKLRKVGVRYVRGFMLNATHYDWTRANIRYGVKLSRRLGGKHFIINTALNGRGPVHYFKRVGRRRREVRISCHPLYRGLGPRPTTRTAHPKVDAYMWIASPGYSSGSCNGGPVPVGTWWPKRALGLAKWATSWLGPPGGTRYGHRRGRFSARDVAGDQYR